MRGSEWRLYHKSFFAVTSFHLFISLGNRCQIKDRISKFASYGKERKKDAAYNSVHGSVRTYQQGYLGGGQHVKAGKWYYMYLDRFVSGSRYIGIVVLRNIRYLALGVRRFFTSNSEPFLCL